MRTLLGVGLCLLGLYGCSESGERLLPTQPRDVEPVITTPDTYIYIGQNVTFAANGANLRWGSDAPGVATADPSGRVTGIGSGRATIWAENAAGRTTRLLRSLPSFAGEWSGSYEVIGCQSSGHWSDAGFCSGNYWDGGFSPGLVFDVTLDLRQEADRITAGSFRLGERMPTGRFAPATVAESGVLSLAVQAGPVRGEHVELEHVQFESVTPGTIAGTFDQVWSSSDLTGDGRLICRLRTMVRSSAASGSM